MDAFVEPIGKMSTYQNDGTLMLLNKMYQGMTTEMHTKLNIDIIAGARPNFIKIAAIIHAFALHTNAKAENLLSYRLIHRATLRYSHESKIF